MLFSSLWRRFIVIFVATLLVIGGFRLVWMFTLPNAVQSQPSPPQTTNDLTLLHRGKQLQIDGKTYPVAWAQWQKGNTVHTGLSDTGAMQTLGLTLLSTDNPAQQPTDWFAATPWPLETQFRAPFRYLDITPLLQQAEVTPYPQGQNLVLSSPTSEILTLREGPQPWGKRVVLELSEPTFWQVSQAKTEAVVMINAKAANQLTGGTGFNSSGNLRVDDDDLGGSGKGSIRYRLESRSNNSKLHFQLPAGSQLQVSTLANPSRLVIDARPDGIPQRQIQWADGIQWQQTTVNLERSQFPVTLVKVNPCTPGVQLRPVMANPSQAQGTEPLLSITRQQTTSVAINGGFFNRKNRLPLGAVRSDNQWQSGPILNRGAIAWNDEGQVQVGRLTMTETLQTNTEQRLTIRYLNSGYVQRGIARYTPAWGPAYIPLTDNEQVYVVQQGQITATYPLGKAGSTQMPIPADGYLLLDRGRQISPTALRQGTAVTLTAQTVPAEFQALPQVMGGGPLLINQGRIVVNAAAEKFSRAFQQQQASRSAIAVNGQGEILLAAAHNRVGGRGPSLLEWAQILQRLGAVEAVNLDGGSSTSLALGGHLLDRSPVTAARVSNGIGVFVR